MPNQQFFIHCAEDFSLEQEGIEDVSIFRKFEEALGHVRKLQRDLEARLTVFDLHGQIILNTVFSASLGIGSGLTL